MVVILLVDLESKIEMWAKKMLCAPTVCCVLERNCPWSIFAESLCDRVSVRTQIAVKTAFHIYKNIFFLITLTRKTLYIRELIAEKPD